MTWQQSQDAGVEFPCSGEEPYTHTHTHAATCENLPRTEEMSHKGERSEIFTDPGTSIFFLPRSVTPLLINLALKKERKEERA